MLGCLARPAVPCEKGLLKVLGAASVFQLEGDLPKEVRVESNVLTIPSARPEDTGIYVCTASNRQGKVTAFSMLKVRGEFSRPVSSPSKISFSAAAAQTMGGIFRKGTGSC